MGLVTRRIWPSCSCHSGGGRHILVAASDGVATAFLTDVTAVLSVRTVVSGDVVVVLGGRRRWSFLREGPNGSALLVEVRLLSSGRARAGRTRWGGSGGPRS
ncbi:hypothetical protein Taro_047536 [Colocasia esculenta]|uniref:Uncharacterized protein n=1 Tax=Colocasia esculenta TaxID=4460 RepID=A0A843WT73_COLES|nr:hypothetical protein [Colocasia esculenta]